MAEEASAKGARAIPRIIAVEELPAILTGGGGLGAAAAALRRDEDSSNLMVVDEEIGISSPVEFVTPGTLLGGDAYRVKPGPLSVKKRAADRARAKIGMDSIDLTSEKEYDSDESLRSVKSTASISSTRSGVKRKRRNPYNHPMLTTGEYIGRGEARKELARLELRQLELQAEREMAGTPNEARIIRAAGLLLQATAEPSPSPSPGRETPAPTPASPGTKPKNKNKIGGNSEKQDPPDMGLQALRRKVATDLEKVDMVASRSNNLKGTYVKTLRDAAQSIRDAVEAMATKQSNPEIARLEKANYRLEAANRKLRTEMENLKKEVQGMREVIEGTGKEERRPDALHTPLPTRTQEIEMSEEEGSRDQKPPAKNRPTHHAYTHASAPPNVKGAEKSTIDNETVNQLTETIMRQVAEMLGNRIAAIEDRLLPQ